MPPFLALHLVGPIQAWGETTVGDDRPTMQFPTASGVLGLVAAALGIERPEVERLAALHRDAEVAVRIDSPGQTLWDFHTTRGTRRAERGWNPEAVVSQRQYLHDASFTVVLGHTGADSAQLDTWQAALTAPRFPLSLGRRNCVPAVRIFAARISSSTIFEALLEAPIPTVTAPPRRLSDPIDAFLPGALADVPGRVRTLRIRDRLIGPGARMFAEREVTHVRIPRTRLSAASSSSATWFAETP